MGLPVEDIVEDLLPKIGHPDFVDIGKDQSDPGLDPGRVLPDAVPFSADIPARLFHRL
jgi:hypothetical protein